MRRFWLSVPFQLISLASAIVSLWFAFDKGLQDATGPIRLALWMLFGMAMSTVGVLVWQEYRYSRKTRYAEALKNIAEMLRLRTTNRQRLSADAALGILQQMVEQTGQAFSLITGTSVGVCLRSVGFVTTDDGKRRYYAEDVCRDSTSHDRVIRTRHTKARIEGPTHWIDSSTAYNYLFTNLHVPGRDFYLCNDLPHEIGYTTASFETFGRPKDVSWPIVSFILRSFNWTLPYKSTLNLRMIHIDSITGRPELLGFLSLDSSSRRVFNRNYDVTLCRIVTEAIQPMLATYLNLAARSSPDGSQYALRLVVEGVAFDHK